MIYSLFNFVRQLGFEPKTYGLENRCSIQLSYWRLFCNAKVALYGLNAK